MVNEITERVKSAGPFNLDAHKVPLEAVKRTLETETVRWLMGMQRELTETGNVYGQRLEPEVYQELLDETLLSEYQKKMIYLSLRKEPLSVRRSTPGPTSAFSESRPY